MSVAMNGTAAPKQSTRQAATLGNEGDHPGQVMEATIKQSWTNGKLQVRDQKGQSLAMNVNFQQPKVGQIPRTLTAQLNKTVSPNKSPSNRKESPQVQQYECQ